MSLGKKVILVILSIALAVFLIFELNEIINNAKFDGEHKELFFTLAKDTLDKYGLDDVVINDIVYWPDISSQKFGNLSDPDKINLFLELEEKLGKDDDFSVSMYRVLHGTGGLAGGMVIESNGHRYRSLLGWDEAQFCLYYDKNGDGVDECVFSVTNPDYRPRSNTYSSSGGTKSKCSLCNGTGRVKYYYGGSAFEALIDGHENSWYGICPSCNGTGKKIDV